MDLTPKKKNSAQNRGMGVSFAHGVEVLGYRTLLIELQHKVKRARSMKHLLIKQLTFELPGFYSDGLDLKFTL